MALFVKELNIEKAKEVLDRLLEKAQEEIYPLMIGNMNARKRRRLKEINDEIEILKCLKNTL